VLNKIAYNHETGEGLLEEKKVAKKHQDGEEKKEDGDGKADTKKKSS
jgi:hypothetical protein